MVAITHVDSIENIRVSDTMGALTNRNYCYHSFMKFPGFVITSVLSIFFLLNLPVNATPLEDAVELMEQNKLDQSLELVNSAILDAGNDFELFLLRGLLLSRLQQNDTAASWYRKMISIWPDRLGLRMNLGIIYERQQHFESAFKIFAEVSRKNPQHKLSLQKMADMHIKLAAITYGKLLKSDTNNDGLRRRHFLSSNFADVAATLKPDNGKVDSAANSQ